MIIHSYFTEGYFGWAKLFVRSLKKTNGDEIELILSSRNLPQPKVNELLKLHGNITIINSDLNYDKMAKRAKINKETLLKYKNEVETKKVDKNNKVWKLMIAAEDRLKEIYDVLENNKGEPLLHVDIDTYVKKDITPILETVMNNDFTTRWRIEKQIKRDGHVKYENRATLISVQGYNGSDNSVKFLKTWIDHLTNVPPHKRPAGFGQTACYRAYLDWKDIMSFGDIPPEFLSPQGHGKGILWGANKGNKEDVLKEYKNEYKMG